MEFEKSYWNDRYSKGGNSGYGTYGDQLDKKLEWLKGLDIKSITDIGCGDFYFGKNLLDMYPEAKYKGFDISEAIIERNKRIYPYSFEILSEKVPQADMVLCIDVLFHIMNEEDVEKTLSLLENSWTKYLALTAYERDEEKTNHVRIRKFDVSRFGIPIIREIVEKDGDLYFYLFKK